MMTEDYSAHLWVQHIPTHPAQQYDLFSVWCRLWLPSILECKQIIAVSDRTLVSFFGIQTDKRYIKLYSNSLASHSYNNVRFLVKKKDKNQSSRTTDCLVQTTEPRMQLDTWGKSVGLRIKFCAAHSERALCNFFHRCSSTSKLLTRYVCFPSRMSNVNVCVFTENSGTHCQHNDVHMQKHPTVFGSVSSVSPGWFTEKTSGNRHLFLVTQTGSLETDIEHKSCSVEWSTAGVVCPPASGDNDKLITITAWCSKMRQWEEFSLFSDNLLSSVKYF